MDYPPGMRIGVERMRHLWLRYEVRLRRLRLQLQRRFQHKPKQLVLVRHGFAEQQRADS